jgi:hypothetical protein
MAEADTIYRTLTERGFRAGFVDLKCNLRWKEIELNEINVMKLCNQLAHEILSSQPVPFSRVQDRSTRILLIRNLTDESKLSYFIMDA